MNSKIGKQFLIQFKACKCFCVITNDHQIEGSKVQLGERRDLTDLGYTRVNLHCNKSER